MDPTAAAAAGSGAAARGTATGAAGGRLGVLEPQKDAAKVEFYHYIIYTHYIIYIYMDGWVDR